MVINSTLQTQTQYPYTKLAFGKGEVKFWTDFDGTLFPVKNNDIDNEKVARKLKGYFGKVDSFFSSSNGKAECNITTGRNFVSFNDTYKRLREKDVNVPRADHLVTSDGGDTFLKGDPIQKWPDYRNVDSAKREEIHRLTNWDGEFIRSRVIELFKELDIPLCQPLNVNPPVERNIFPVLRNDGALNICIDIPQDMWDPVLVDKISNNLRKSLDEKGMKYELYYEDYIPAYHRGPCILIAPRINEETLNKSYDIKKAIAQASKEEDLVIVAGDYINDLEMLNPETYAKTPEELAKLPLKSIIVGDNPDLLKLAKKYPKNFVVVDKFEILEGIKKAIKDYVSTHPDFEIKPEIEKQLAPDSNLSKIVQKAKDIIRTLFASKD